MNVILTNHAYEQYLKRVGEIDRDELTARLADQITHPHERVRDIILLDGVWWACRNNVFITCYGNTHIDLPAALSWAELHNDRIVL